MGGPSIHVISAKAGIHYYEEAEAVGDGGPRRAVGIHPDLVSALSKQKADLLKC